MKETATTTTSLGSIGQITEDHELVVDIDALVNLDSNVTAEVNVDLAVDLQVNNSSAAKAEQETNLDSNSYRESNDDDYGDEIVDNYADSWSYEVPRPWLTVDQAASMLGRSTRGVERSILGRWGNHLPEGWAARRVRIDGVEEWRIIPPPGFRIKHSRRETNRREARAENQNQHQSEDIGENHIEDVEVSPLSATAETTRDKQAEKLAENMATKSHERKMAPTPNPAVAAPSSPNEPFSLEKFLQSAGKMAQKELASLGLAVGPVNEPRRNRATRSNNELAGIIDADIEHATIVIDRSDEVEKLLRELANTQKELAEQRRMHLDDLRLMQEMQRSMLLLEVNAKETGELKQDLSYAQQALKEHRSQYQAFLALPWYKRLFRKTP
ncbi:hypothetical protein KBI23_06210 [bacterium]|nr:hypothetical protein [bacterium]MBP9809508.1 hypothetical protein [bacterium]